MRAAARAGAARRRRPAAAISLLPGEGDVGAALVRHPDVQTIAFTGSLPVGLEIVRARRGDAPGQRHLKRVVAELGGKNCVIVDSDADLDEAVPAIVSSAFVYAGQKCSAAARVLVHEAIADQLIERVAGAVSGARGRPGRPARDRRAAGDRARRPGAGRALRADRAAREGRIAARRGAGARRADGSVPPRSRSTCRPDSPVLERGDLRPAAGDRARQRRRACLRHRRRSARSR